jgi:hypothetical protein
MQWLLDDDTPRLIEARGGAKAPGTVRAARSLTGFAGTTYTHHVRGAPCAPARGELDSTSEIAWRELVLYVACVLLEAADRLDLFHAAGLRTRWDRAGLFCCPRVR